MTANMTVRPRLKQGEQSLECTRFESGGAGKAVFAAGPAGRVGPAAILGLSKGSKASGVPDLSRTARAKRCFAVGPAGRVGSAVIRGGAGFYIGCSFGAGRCG